MDICCLVLMKIRNKKVTTGPEELIGAAGEAMTDFEQEGRIWIHGESWLATTETPVKKGQRVQITAIDGLKLQIKTTHTQEEY